MKGEDVGLREGRVVLVRVYVYVRGTPETRSSLCPDLSRVPLPPSQ